MPAHRARHRFVSTARKLHRSFHGCFALLHEAALQPQPRRQVAASDVGGPARRVSWSEVDPFSGTEVWATEQGNAIAMSAQRATDGTKTRVRLRIVGGNGRGRVRALNEDVDVTLPKRGLFAWGAPEYTARGVIVAVHSAQEQNTC